MNARENKKIFNKYNPVKEIKRCPNGKAILRKQLDEYAKAAVNLYGVILLSEFVDIFNEQNVEQTTIEEVKLLLLPLVIKKEFYCFYAEYLVHHFCIDDFSYADYLIQQQKDKPRYLPSKQEFIKFADYTYRVLLERELRIKMFRFILSEMKFNHSKYPFFDMINDCCELSLGPRAVISNMEKLNVQFYDEKEASEFMLLFQELSNNTKI